MSYALELLAPAGDWSALEAALAAGADSVYLGLRTLNARRRAKNFSPDEFVKAVEAVHARGVKAYLTLNIDLAQRELGQAARMLELARQCRADAVLVRDPALLALRPEYPELEFHFSTQTCMANSADVAAAARLGANRVVLAREMTIAEIAAASAVPEMETEVFVQGALCFSISGRCLLSSWVGCRSGNRGACTSPCRVPWMVLMDCPNFRINENGTVPFNAREKDSASSDTPLSMKDLSLVDRLPELLEAGVSAIKIEGRLKNAAWVSQAVSLYKRALAGEEVSKLREEVGLLGAYTGRSLTSAYLNGRRDDLIGQAEGRQSASFPKDAATDATLPDSLPNHEEEEIDEVPTDDSAPSESAYNLRMMIEAKGITCTCECGCRKEQWTIPKTVIRRAHKAIAIGTFFNQLAEGSLQGYKLGGHETNDAEFLLTPRAVNSLIDRISIAIRLSNKLPDDSVRIDLPSVVGNLLNTGESSESNRLHLGKKPDRVRLDAKSAAAFLRRVRPKGIIVEGLNSKTLDSIRELCENVSLIVALPGVFFEDDIPRIKRLLQKCVDEGVTVEVNSWGGWRLAKSAKATMEAGPGLPVLNSLAAKYLADKGIKCVTLSPEADRRQLEDLTANCPVACSLIIFGRPPLLTTRVQVPERYLNQVLTDRRNVEIIPCHEHGLYIFRPKNPFDLRATVNERIRVKHLVVDLIGSDDPIADWQGIPLEDEKPFRFNYDRTLA